MSKVEDRVVKKLLSRADTGLKKYGTTMEREDLTTVDWLIHLQEELMDGAVYIEKLLEVLGHIRESSE